MRQVKIYYSDKEFSNRGERFDTRPMSVDKAKEMIPVLETLGCHNFELVPVKQEAA